MAEDTEKPHVYNVGPEHIEWDPLCMTIADCDCTACQCQCIKCVPPKTMATSPGGHSIRLPCDCAWCTETRDCVEFPVWGKLLEDVRKQDAAYSDELELEMKYALREPIPDKTCPRCGAAPGNPCNSPEEMFTENLQKDLHEEAKKLGYSGSCPPGFVQVPWVHDVRKEK
jgi:hypothetical protein